jgi:mRNA interferase RelE/StbE
VSGAWRYELTPRAERDMARCPMDVRRRVFAALDRLVAGGGAGNVRRLAGQLQGDWRLRIGDWRVRFRPDRERRVYVILRVLPRGRAYRN